MKDKEKKRLFCVFFVGFLRVSVVISIYDAYSAFKVIYYIFII